MHRMSQTGASIIRWIEMDQLKDSILGKRNVFDRQDSSDLPIKGGRTETSTHSHLSSRRKFPQSKYGNQLQPYTQPSPSQLPSRSKPSTVSPAVEQAVSRLPLVEQAVNRLPSRGPSRHSPPPAVEQAVSRLPSRGASRPAIPLAEVDTPSPDQASSIPRCRKQATASQRNRTMYMPVTPSLRQEWLRFRAELSGHGRRDGASSSPTVDHGLHATRSRDAQHPG